MGKGDDDEEEENELKSLCQLSSNPLAHCIASYLSFDVDVP